MLHVTDAKYLSEYRVKLVFNDGTRGIVDLKSKLTGPIFEQLLDLTLFSQCYVHPETDTLTWPNGADFAPEYLIDQMIPETEIAS